MTEKFSDQFAYSAVTILGLGNMGAALAQAFLNAGHKVTVWNRNASRAEPLTSKGAIFASSPAEAIAASPLAIMCVLDNKSVEAILNSEGLEHVLSEKTLVQFTTCNTEELSNQQKWITANGGRFLAGAILVLPSGIGKPDCLIVYAGDDRAFEEHSTTFSALGNSPEYLGTNLSAVIGAFSTLAAFGAGTLGTFYETAAIARRFGLPLESYHRLARRIVYGLLLDGMQEATQRVTSGHFPDNLANIDLGLVTLENILKLFEDSGIPAIMTQAAIEQLRLASASGDGCGDLAYIIESLARDNG